MGRRRAGGFLSITVSWMRSRTNRQGSMWKATHSRRKSRRDATTGFLFGPKKTTSHERWKHRLETSKNIMRKQLSLCIEETKFRTLFHEEIKLWNCFHETIRFATYSKKYKFKFPTGFRILREPSPYWSIWTHIGPILNPIGYISNIEPILGPYGPNNIGPYGPANWIQHGPISSQYLLIFDNNETNRAPIWSIISLC